MRKCEKCGAELAEDAVFCHECGARVARTAVCAKCGKELRAGAKFCDGCGTPVQAGDDEIQEAIKGGKIKVNVDGKELIHEEVMDVYEKGGRFDVEVDSLETKIDKIISSLPAEDQKFIREYKVFKDEKEKEATRQNLINRCQLKSRLESNLKEFELVSNYTAKDAIMIYIKDGIGLAYYEKYDMKDIIMAAVNALRDRESKETYDTLESMIIKNEMGSYVNDIVFGLMPCSLRP